MLVAKALVGGILANESADGVAETGHCQYSFPDEGHKTCRSVLEVSVFWMVQEPRIEFVKRYSYKIQSESSTYPSQYAGAEKFRSAHHLRVLGP